MVRISSFVRGPRAILRLRTIARVFISHGLGYFVDRYVRAGYLPAWFRLRRTKVLKPDAETLPHRLTRAMEELGPTFVKLGQMLATRPDILPENYIQEFRRIYHKVSPFEPAVAKAIIEEDLGAPIQELFSTFSDAPRASGSVAQAHDATLPDGTPVVVKVRRPGIEKTIENDLHILHWLADGTQRIEDLRPLQLPKIVAEFARGVRSELDFVNEASTITRFHAAFKESRTIVIPNVFWRHTTCRVLTMQRLEGRNFAELEERNYEGVDRKRVANLLANAFLDQVFRAGIFHADPHPGNLIYMADGRVGLIDFGLVGTLAGDLRAQFSTILIALARDQLDLAAEVFADMGLIPPDVEAGLFKADAAALFQKYYGIPIINLDAQQVFMDLMQVAREYSVSIPRDAVLLGKCVATITSVTQTLDRDVSLAELAQPYAKALIHEKVSRKNIEKHTLEQVYHLTNLLLDGPRDVRSLLKKLRSGQFEMNVKHEEFERYVSDIDRTGNRLAMSVILASIIIGSSQILKDNIGPTIGHGAWQMSVLGISGYLVALALGLWLVFGIFKSGRL